MTQYPDRFLGAGQNGDMCPEKPIVESRLEENCLSIEGALEYPCVDTLGDGAAKLHASRQGLFRHLALADNWLLNLS